MKPQLVVQVAVNPGGHWLSYWAQLQAVVGAGVGADVGALVGADVGALVGALVGADVGALVGADVGAGVGAGVVVVVVVVTTRNEAARIPRGITRSSLRRVGIDRHSYAIRKPRSRFRLTCASYSWTRVWCRHPARK